MHPYAKHSENAVGHARAKKICKQAGGRAPMRSENTEAARARQQLNKAYMQPYSIIGAAIHPEQASLVDAMRRKEFKTLERTGYGPAYGTQYQKNPPYGTEYKRGGRR